MQRQNTKQDDIRVGSVVRAAPIAALSLAIAHALACGSSARDESKAHAVESGSTSTPAISGASPSGVVSAGQPPLAASAPGSATEVRGTADLPVPGSTHGIEPPDPKTYENEPERFLPKNPGCAVPKGMPTWSWDTLYTVDGLDVDAIVLTLDVGTRLPNLEKVLDILREKKVRATMFLYTGDLARSPRGPEIVKRIIADGHELGNHTFTHRDLSKLNDGDIGFDVDAVEAFVQSSTGLTTRPFFRAPYLAVNSTVDRVIQKRCYRSIWLSVDTRDDRDDTTAKDIVQAVLQDRGKPRVFKRGNIFLFHGGQPENLKALPIVIDGIRAAGFSMLPLSDALRLAKPDHTRERVAASGASTSSTGGAPLGNTSKHSP